MQQHKSCENSQLCNLLDYTFEVDRVSRRRDHLDNTPRPWMQRKLRQCCAAISPSPILRTPRVDHRTTPIISQSHPLPPLTCRLLPRLQAPERKIARLRRVLALDIGHAVLRRHSIAGQRGVDASAIDRVRRRELAGALGGLNLRGGLDGVAAGGAVALLVFV